MWSEAPPARWVTSVGALVEAGVDRLTAAGIASARRDARRIVEDLLGLPPGRLALDRDAPVSPADRERLAAAFDRRAEGEPLEYVTGMAGFRRLTLRVDRRALIPRPETEGVVDRALAIGRTGVAADVGTGTGCLALCLRMEGGYQRVVGIDRSAEAIDLARRNRRGSGLAVDLIRGDLASALEAGSVDVLVSNPPYVSESEYAELDPSVRDYEPRLALVSGADGLEATGRLIEDGLRVVRPGGGIVLELAAERADRCAELAAGAGWRNVRIDQDLFGRPRYLVARREGDR